MRNILKETSNDIHIDLSFCELTTIPPSVIACDTLVIFCLSNNYLTGFVFDVSFPFLRLLDLSHNNITTLSIIREQVQVLGVLDVSCNPLEELFGIDKYCNSLIVNTLNTPYSERTTLRDGSELVGPFNHAFESSSNELLYDAVNSTIASFQSGQLALFKNLTRIINDIICNFLHSLQCIGLYQ